MQAPYVEGRAHSQVPCACHGHLAVPQGSARGVDVLAEHLQAREGSRNAACLSAVGSARGGRGAGVSALPASHAVGKAAAQREDKIHTLPPVESRWGPNALKRQAHTLQHPAALNCTAHRVRVRALTQVYAVSPAYAKTSML